MLKTNLPDIYIDDIDAELCRRKLSLFVREFWNVIVPNDLIWNWHMDVICDEVEAIYKRVFLREKKLHDLIINVPPGTSKTKIASIFATCWALANKPDLRIAVGSYSDAATLAISDNVRLVMKCPKYKRFYPKTIIRRDKDTAHNFKTTLNGEFYGFTVNGTITSMHFDALFIDDPLNPKLAASKVELENTINFFDKTLPTRKVDKEVTPTCLIMQRLAVNDPTGHLLTKGLPIRHISLSGTSKGFISPIELRKKYTNGLLDEGRLNANVLSELKIGLGSSGFAGQIEQMPVPDGGYIWQKWFIIVPDVHFPDKKFLSNYGTDWDLAYTKDDENAASAYVTAGKIKNDIYLDDIGWDWLEFPALINWMKTKPAPHFIENKASGKSAKQTLVRHGVPAIEVSVEGGDKIARAKMATPIAESGMVYVRESIADKLYNDSNQGILFFPKGKFKDLADTLAQSLQRLNNKKGLVVSKTSDGSLLDELEF